MTHSFSSPEGRAALDEFHRAFGRTMTAWSSVEEGIFEWFKACTGLDELVARAVFYSAKSFTARRDMLIAALPFSPFDEKTNEGIRLCAKRARAYADFRNKIAHGHVVRSHVIDPPQIAFTQGKTLFPSTRNDHVTIDELRIAAENFEKLADLLLGFHPEWQAPDACEAGCLEEIRALPTLANSREPSPIEP